jgi:hypothetical protein
VNENKAEVVGSRVDRSEPLRTASVSGEAKARTTNIEEAGAAAPKASRVNGAATKALAEETVSDQRAADDKPEQSLGTFLIAARERRGLSAEDVVRETRLPAHYLRMMESNDYSEISDQLYLVPFLRRYAGFLALDQEDVAMRFVREVQRADSIPPARLDQPLIAEPRRRRGWVGAIVVIGFLATAAGVYVYESERHPQASSNNLGPGARIGTSSGGASGIVPQAPH